MNNEVVVRLPAWFANNAEAAGFIYAALSESKPEDISGAPAVVWKEKGEPWRLFTDGGAQVVDKGLVFSDE